MQEEEELMKLKKKGKVKQHVGASAATQNQNKIEQAIEFKDKSELRQL
jgi:hypothetical protein